MDVTAKELSAVSSLEFHRMSNKPPKIDHGAALRSVDRDLLESLLTGDLFSIGDLTHSLNVTATAIRQRIERLLERGLIEREKVVAGRGRPTFQYRITDQGRRVTSADSTELAEAMWRELLSIEDAELRERLLQSVATRLGREYASQLDGNAPLEERMRVLSSLLSSRRMDSDVRTGDSNVGEGLPVLDIASCPFPTLADGTTDHSMCRLEEQVLSEALGEQVHLSMCRLDGDSCCQFAPIEETGSESNESQSMSQT